MDLQGPPAAILLAAELAKTIEPNVRFGWKADISASSFVRMSWRPSVKLSVLRDIGWDRWDPIRLNGAHGGWRCSHAAEEYDRYLLRVADRLQSGEPYSALVDYLVGIETEHMGLVGSQGRGHGPKRPS